MTKEKPSRFTAWGLLHTFSFFQFYSNLSVFLEVCYGYSWINHASLITSAKLDYFIYKSKKL